MLLSVSEFYSFIQNTEKTSHIKMRNYRFKHLNLSAEPIDGFIAIIDKHHINGAEVHALYSDGSIRIYNLNTKKLITVLIARPGQAKRLNPEIQLPEEIYNICYRNMKNKYNH